ncbi:hypothetical protein NPS29_25535, partial [Pseudomonas putida]|uniref:hypothetical protein n=1 Tax=Pseudomonas putida TaxID=303 RepID=UPI002363C02E
MAKTAARRAVKKAKKPGSLSALSEAVAEAGVSELKAGHPSKRETADCYTPVSRYMPLTVRNLMMD